MLSHTDSYEAEGQGAISGIPGTDTNTEENTYVIEDGTNSTYSVNEESSDYLPSERISNRVTPPGVIDYGSSSIAVTASHYVIYKENELKNQGLLDGITFDEFVAENSDMVRKTVDDDLVTLVANATGIPVANVSIIAYDVPIFQAAEGFKVDAADIAQIVLIVLILALLGFVVFSSLRREKEEVEEEEELSVENMLETTQENMGVEDIELETKSEVRLMVEKFVDDNPDAAAQLLRNWLNEEWG